MNKQEIKEVLINKFVEMRSVDGLIDYMIGKNFINEEVLKIAIIRNIYFNRVRKYANDQTMTLTQIKQDIAEENKLSFQSIERYIYDKKVNL